jgi:phage terminase large subunit-like protein
VREVMIEGVSGLLAVHAWHERPAWLPSRKRLEWRDGQIAQVFSAEDPESLRGPQFCCAWSDEMAKWRYAEAAFDMLQFGLRLGAQPRQLITTTPRPTALLKRLIDDPSSVVTRAATRANANNLAPTFLQTVISRYAGTRLGQQELEGKIIEDRPDALWSRSLLESCRVAAAPSLQRIVVAVDPPANRRADRLIDSTRWSGPSPHWHSRRATGRGSGRCEDRVPGAMQRAARSAASQNRDPGYL